MQQNMMLYHFQGTHSSHSVCSILPLTTRGHCGTVTCFDLAFWGGETGFFLFFSSFSRGSGVVVIFSYHYRWTEYSSLGLHAAQLCCTHFTTWNFYLHCVCIMYTITAHSLLYVTQKVIHSCFMLLIDLWMFVVNAYGALHIWKFFFLTSLHQSVC